MIMPFGFIRRRASKNMIYLHCDMWRLLGLICMLLKESCVDARSNDSNANYAFLEAEVAKKIIKLSVDSTYFPPEFEKSTPVIVTVSYFIVSVHSISESDFDMELTIRLQQSWVDPRWVYKYQYPSVKYVELDPQYTSEIWFPDIMFSNAKKACFHTLAGPNVLVHVYPDGWTYVANKLKLLLRCDMDLRKFPFDSQTCYLKMESYSFTKKNINLRWKNNPMFKGKLQLPGFVLMGIDHVYCNANQTSGDYPCLLASIHLRRSYGYYVIQIYIPSILVVILSWVSFWLDVEAVPARITLGLLTVLTMTTQSTNAGGDLPKISYIKAIDVWISTCIIFVCAALMEFAYVNVKARLEDWFTWCGYVNYEPLTAVIESKVEVDNPSENKSSKTSPLPSSTNIKREDSIKSLSSKKSNSNHVVFKQPSLKSPSLSLHSQNQNNGSSENYSNPSELFEFDNEFIASERAKHVDRVSRIAFPLTFGVFNIIYWTFYLS